MDQATVQRRREKTDKPGKSLRKAWEWLKDLVTKPNPFLVAREAFGSTSVLDRFLYVTDGGHYDNLGMLEALRRQPKNVVVLDASNDPEDSFATLGHAIATARMDLGCEVKVDPRAMRRLDQKHAGVAWAHGHITYRADSEGNRLSGELWIAKAVMLDTMPWDVETYHNEHLEFPRTSTSRQLYGEFDLEAYRELGRQVVEDMMPYLNNGLTVPHVDQDQGIARAVAEQVGTGRSEVAEAVQPESGGDVVHGGLLHLVRTRPGMRKARHSR